MALTKAARSKILSLVQQAKALLMKEVEGQLQQYYGIRTDGTVLLVEQLTASDSDIIYTAGLLRQRLAYLKASLADDHSKETEAVRQLIREQAFTILNRFASLRMAEERGIIKETIRNAYNSEGFLVFDEITGQGQTAPLYVRYQWYLHAIFDELALDLPAIFDRYSPYALIFPSEQAMNKLLDIINIENVALHREEGLQPVNLWREDETIGWIYQYYNSREEISVMREASGAPRNSQELAVRNQFFTPHYVVQFLTDNSLGRIWYEMTRGNTVLKTACPYLIIRTSEVFLNKGEHTPEQTVEGVEYVEYRPIKDPRKLLMLDPACGSMHFGLYCFDLFEQIYLETWDSYPELLTELRNKMTREAFVRQIPELIIRHNIHGVDIDPRALQIAGLSLWLRAQKSFDKQNLPTDQRPQITKSNLVLAEPMPSSINTLSELVKPLDAPMRKLVLAIWDKMKIAGETGLLLRMEEEIDQTIKEIAKELGDATLKTQLTLEGGVAELQDAEDARVYASKQYRDQFLESAEAEVLKVLKQIAETATEGDAYQKLLFAEDAARGFGFIELCRKQYDVVLMNPPFGLGIKKHFEWLKTEYPDGYTDLLAAFVQRGFELSSSYVGAITSRSILVTPKLERMRLNTLINSFDLLLDLGSPVMDNAMVQSAAYILSKSNSRKQFLAVDRKQTSEKHIGLESINYDDISSLSYLVQKDDVFHLPRYKILYNLPESILTLFQKSKKLSEIKIHAKRGAQSFDDFRFVRIRHEVLPKNIGKSNKFRSFSKGGEFSVLYSDLNVLIKYENEGLEVQEVNRIKNGMSAQAKQSATFYYLPGGNYSRRCKDFGVRILPEDFVLGEKGPIVLSQNVEISNITLVGLLNSNFYNFLVNIQANANQYDTGIIESLPILDIDQSGYKRIEDAVILAINSLREVDTFNEQCSIFHSLPLGPSFREVKETIDAHSRNAENAVQNAFITINDVVDNAIGIDSEDLLNRISEFSDDEENTRITFKDKIASSILKHTNVELAERIASYVFGITYGRWVHPSEMTKLTLTENNIFKNFNADVPGLSLKENEDVLFAFDEKKHQASFEKALAKTFVSQCGSNELANTTLELLGSSSFTEYFRDPNRFFEDHFRLYTSSRRLAPVYWPISSSSGSFVVWVYYPKLGDQTLYKIVNNFIIPKKEELIKELGNLEHNVHLDNIGKKELAALQEMLRELKDMEENLLSIAALPYKPNLDDGVLISAAPLHRFFKHAKWKTATEACWNALEKGEYDWARLAYNIWPERVRKKCTKDLSMAIAHGEESIYEVKPKEKKEKKAAKPTVKSKQGKLIQE